MIIAVNFQFKQSTTAVQIWIISYTSHHFTPHGRYELNKLTSLPMCGFIAQLVEQRTGNAEVTGSNPVEALIFFRLLLSNCLNWKIHCDDHSSLSSTTAVQIWIISYTSHQRRNSYLFKSWKSDQPVYYHPFGCFVFYPQTFTQLFQVCFFYSSRLFTNQVKK